MRLLIAEFFFEQNCGVKQHEQFHCGHAYFVLRTEYIRIYNMRIAVIAEKPLRTQ
jgi:hypothetical protein